jgi:23S rRNA (cytidine1920-2'-O)/16S rRNA (cytidine1409-2'-O)-methyltransferase
MVRSRTEAALAIRSGRVTVAGRPASKAATLVAAEEPIRMASPPRRFVSRGGEKLEAALDQFAVDVTGCSCLDAGASTGGFTDCLLSRGASHVVAVDVGYGQLDWRLRDDPRVTVMERTNVRDLEPDALPYRPDVVTADLSFISLALTVPALARCASETATFVLLVKPQFESGPELVGPGGVVTDPAAWRTSIERVADATRRAGAEPLDVMASPLIGPAGNAEFLLIARRGADAQGIEAKVERARAEAEALVATGIGGHRG